MACRGAPCVSSWIAGPDPSGSDDGLFHRAMHSDGHGGSSVQASYKHAAQSARLLWAAAALHRTPCGSVLIALGHKRHGFAVWDRNIA